MSIYSTSKGLKRMRACLPISINYICRQLILYWGVSA